MNQSVPMVQSRSSSSSSVKTLPRRPSSASSIHSSVSSTACALSSTASIFEESGTRADRQRRKPLGDGKRRDFDFHRIGFLVSKNARDAFNRPKLLVGLPTNVATHIDPYTMKQNHREVIRAGEKIYYCAEKQFLYPSSVFKAKKAARSKKPPKLASIADPTPPHAFIYNSYYECRCAKGRREAILQVDLAAEVEAVLPHGLKDSAEYTSPDFPSDARIRKLSTGKTETITYYDVEARIGTLRRGEKLWWSPDREIYFTAKYINANMRSEADYRRYQVQPPVEHTH